MYLARTVRPGSCQIFAQEFLEIGNRIGILLVLQEVPFPVSQSGDSDSSDCLAVVMRLKDTPVGPTGESGHMPTPFHASRAL